MFNNKKLIEIEEKKLQFLNKQHDENMKLECLKIGKELAISEDITFVTDYEVLVRNLLEFLKTEKFEN